MKLGRLKKLKGNDMTPKEEVYFLLEEFNSGNYTVKDFSELFSFTYFRKINTDELNKKEKRLYRELADMTDRFSPFEEDLKIPNMYFSESDVKQKAQVVFEELFVK